MLSLDEFMADDTWLRSATFGPKVRADPYHMRTEASHDGPVEPMKSIPSEQPARAPQQETSSPDPARLANRFSTVQLSKKARTFAENGEAHS